MGDIGYDAYELDVLDADLERYFDILAEKKGPDAVIELIEKYCLKYVLFTIGSSKNDQKNLQEAVEKIKAIQGAERDRIKPETALFELTKEIFTCKKKGDKFIPSESDVFKKASNISGKGYLNEFIQKSDADLKDFIVRYHVLKAQIVEELEKNHEYQSAKSLKKDMEYEIEVNLKQMELSAKLSFVELKARKELES
jgi:hypothetical protein